jgi:hypothetical protein
MKYLPFVTAFLVGVLISSFAHDINLSDRFWKWKIETTAGTSIADIEAVKADCEKSGKECAMIWEFVEVEADY